MSQSGPGFAQRLKPSMKPNDYIISWHVIEDHTSALAREILYSSQENLSITIIAVTIPPIGRECLLCESGQGSASGPTFTN